MRRVGIIFLMVLLMIPWGAVQAREEGGFIVEEDVDEGTPNLRGQARALMQMMSPREKICQMFMVTPEQLTGGSRVTAWPEENVLEKYPVGGIILYGQNIASEKQLKALTEGIQAQADKAGVYSLLIAVDEEGGSVSRVANKLGYPLAPSPQALGQEGRGEEAYAAGSYIASYLAPLGINLSLAPDADVLVAEGDEIGSRSYGADADTVSAMAQAMARGLREGGVIPCYKHFPGHGAVSGNTHNGSASTRRTLDEMRLTELIPFMDGVEREIEMIMTSHLIAKGLEDTEPASLSPTIITQLLRGDMGYDGVVITDSLRMTAIASEYKAAAAAVRAIQAGADILLIPSNLEAAVKAIEDAVSSGTLSMERIEESVIRILALKIQSGVIR